MRQLASNVRINTSGDPFKVTHDVVVEVFENGQWVKLASTHSPMTTRIPQLTRPLRGI